ncbi:acyl-CoA dehydrogenase family protein [Aldersonia kunmingensis]|uniref:acyl-CoA dehydrogenase family protein n=1 Tax=Aldersonia kunmingensis TaxID=408066 RepID=UPI0008300299|nr:acyl-CoA dehydrogenase family protein [Aldersonia kunmingensis]
MTTEQPVSEFRARARAWLAENAPSFPRDDFYGDARTVQGLMQAAGFAGITWPVEYGGQGLTTTEQREWDEESQAYDVPVDVLAISLGMVTPILLDLGTEEQKQRYVTKLVRGEYIGCQLFSEPAAGSDVAGLRTRAVRDGDEWVINGQKVWTTHAHQAEVGILLARTNPDVPKHQGITMFVIDMHAPGVTVRPLKDMSGASKFNEIFFDDLRLPAGSVVGEVDQGWAAAVQMLRHERLALTARRTRTDNPASYSSLAQEVRRAGRADDPIVRRTLAQIYIGERVGELFSARIAEEIKAGGDPGPRGSVGKLAGGRHARMLADAVTTMFGSGGTVWSADDASGAALSQIIATAPVLRIAGGTDEIQRNIIGERLLGLPKEPK